MSDTARGLVLLVSVLLCLPVLPPLLAGEMTTVDAGLRYACALVLTWAGGSALSALIVGYGADRADDDAPGGSGAASEAGSKPKSRRQDDLSS